MDSGGGGTFLIASRWNPNNLGVGIDWESILFSNSMTKRNRFSIPRSRNRPSPSWKLELESIFRLDTFVCRPSSASPPPAPACQINRKIGSYEAAPPPACRRRPRRPRRAKRPIMSTPFTVNGRRFLTRTPTAT